MQHADTPCAVMIDIDVERAWWQEMTSGATSDLVFLFHEWEPAIRVGIHAHLAYPDRDFDSIHNDLLQVYARIRGRSRVPWKRAAPAARRIWRKLQHASAGDDGADGRSYAACRTSPALPHAADRSLSEA